MPAMLISQLLDQAARRTTRIAPGAQAIPAIRRRRTRGSSASVPSPLRATARSFARSKRGNDIPTYGPARLYDAGGGISSTQWARSHSRRNTVTSTLFGAPISRDAPRDVWPGHEPPGKVGGRGAPHKAAGV